jgi:hypothetical protein
MQNWCHVSFISSNLCSHFFLLCFVLAHLKSQSRKKGKHARDISIKSKINISREAICIIRRSTQKSFTFRFLFLLFPQTFDRISLLRRRRRRFQQVACFGRFEWLFGRYHSIFMMFVLYDGFFRPLFLASLLSPIIRESQGRRGRRRKSRETANDCVNKLIWRRNLCVNASDNALWLH